jgi:hypothetical protein
MGGNDDSGTAWAFQLIPMKPLAYRKVGMLRATKQPRSFIASQLRAWRKTGKVRRILYVDARAYQPDDQFNPYVALVARS